MPCPEGHEQPIPENCKWCKMAVGKDTRYFRLYFNREPPQIKEPSLLKKAVNFVKAVSRHALNGMKEVDEQTYQRRVSLCLVCDSYNQNKQTCGLCGCCVGSRVLDKAKWQSEKCPHPSGNKWE